MARDHILRIILLQILRLIVAFVSFSVAELLVLLLATSINLLFILHAPLGCAAAALGRAGGDANLGCGTSCDRPLRYLHRLLFRFLSLYFFLFIPLVLHVLVQRHRIILLFRLHQFFGSAEAWDVLVLIRDFRSRSVNQITTIMRQLPRLFLRLCLLDGVFDCIPRLGSWRLRRFYLPNFVGSNPIITRLIHTRHHFLKLLQMLELFFLLGGGF